MKLQLDRISGRYAFTGYGDGYVKVNATRHTGNLVVLPDRLIEGWTESNFDTLSVSDFEFLVTLDAEIVILGTGNLLRFPPPELLQPFMKARKGLEIMDIQAACRTYNVLTGEGRNVAAGLIFG
ncbi:Mth938-like domain-containing protein [Propionivibrio limicola]|uniref:Mth938-like domain-containing protein n=1 Tax=Propionivibrio limicola TaxID=167645 RepID=UPI001291365D|nr:Mth938-like domain-containing protein [Propionivibrio limicola]